MKRLLNERAIYFIGEHGMVKRMQKLELKKQRKDPEGELSEWAKRQLAIARATPDSQAVSHEELRKRILKK